jgi:chitinase|tara:strand:+ start:1377 stop:1679 length:303 start_codon:yes stop_codon:yes gene_type:complete
MNRYETIEKFKTERGKTYITNPIYPAIPESEDDIYIIAGIADRYDVLALEFYNDSSLWWIIASSNNHQRASLNATPGKQLRIPADKALALRLFEEVNKSR